MREAHADVHFISTLDDIAWLFNLRGNDVSYNPVFVAHALIGLDAATLIVADGKMPDAIRATLAADGVTIAPYAKAAEVLAALPAGTTLLLDPRRITLAFRQAVPKSVAVVEAQTRT